MDSQGPAAPSVAVTATSARAQAARINGAKSRGPRTPEGKARSSMNALKHGLRAQKHVVLPEEDAAAYQAHASALLAELAPEGALQALLARQVIAAAWRLERAERIEAELFARQRHPECRPRPRPDPGRQHRPRLPDAAPLPRLGRGLAVARAPGAQGASGRGGGACDRTNPGAGAHRFNRRRAAHDAKRTRTPDGSWRNGARRRLSRRAPAPRMPVPGDRR